MPSALRVSAGDARCLAVVASALGLAACGGTSVSGSNSTPPPPPPATYTLGGTVSGLAGAGLVLASNDASVTVAAGSTSFTFANGLSAGTAYAVTVQSSPNGQTCSVANGSGTIGTANVNNVVVTCSNQAYSIGGTIDGLNGSGLVLANGTDQLPVSSGATTFKMGAQVAFSSTYQVTVATQPAGLSCSVQNGTGTMGAGEVTNIKVTCTDQPFTLGGTISGLASTGLKLTDGTDTVQLDSTATTFSFPTRLNYSTPYTVAVAAQPVGMMCSVSSGGSGTMPAADVTSVAITCSNQAYSLGGSISGLTSAGLELTDGTDTIGPIAANTTSFTFQTAVAFSSHYTVSVAAQPTGQTCSVGNAQGQMGAGDVTNVVVTCSINSYTLSGTITGLTFTGLVLTDGTEQVSVAANATQFSMTQGIAYNSLYSVTVAAQPPGVTCTVTNGSGTMPASDVNNVEVACTLFAWTWQGGKNVVDDLGTYPASPGSSSNSYIPSARSGQMAWQTSDGKFWLFGGSTTDYTAATGDFNDLWSYDPGSGEWTWVSGSNLVATSGGSYPGSPNQVGTPPGRQSGAIWVDAHGIVWMFGGANVGGYLNDLWKFDPSSGQWTWVGGTSNSDDGGVYTAPGSLPHSRAAAASWIDAAGNLWLFGGTYYDAGAGLLVPLNDLWMYDPAGATWTLVKGSDTPTNADYGTQGHAASTNMPGARGGAAAWVDKTGKFWLFGGGGFDATQTGGSLNDLWSFDSNTKQWTWVGGSDVINGDWNFNVSTGVWDFAPVGSGSNAAGTTGTMGTASTTSVPSGRSAPVTWTDNAGRLWLFGGLELVHGGAYNDLWAFDPTTLQWTWVNGPYPNAPNGQPGIYGPQGASTNLPGARWLSAGWVGSSGHLWLFGGSGFDGTTPTPNLDNLNDLWEF